MNNNIIRPLSSLQQTAQLRLSGYLEECLKVGKVTGTGASQLVEFTPEQFTALRAKYNNHPSVGSDGVFRPPAPSAQPKTLDSVQIIRTPEEVAACRAICIKCEFYKTPNCCAKIISCTGGLPRYWNNALSHCPIKKW